jgi:hypothetical protein
VHVLAFRYQWRSDQSLVDTHLQVRPSHPSSVHACKSATLELAIFSLSVQTLPDPTLVESKDLTEDVTTALGSFA